MIWNDCAQFILKFFPKILSVFGHFHICRMQIIFVKLVKLHSLLIKLWCGVVWCADLHQINWWNNGTTEKHEHRLTFINIQCSGFTNFVIMQVSKSAKICIPLVALSKRSIFFSINIWWFLNTFIPDVALGWSLIICVQWNK